VVELDETPRLLVELSPKHREIITLICIKELSYWRTARRLKIPIGTVRSRLSRAREELLAAVEGNRYGRRNGEVSRTERGRRRMRALLRQKSAIN
jgi:DNA-directed RNA polymerase specialized sigma24 family protein